MSKDQIRTEMRERRRELTPEWIEEQSEVLQQTVQSLSEFKEAGTVCCYMSLPLEVQTSGIMAACWDAGKNVCVPAYSRDDEEYHLARLRKDDELAEGHFGVREPGRIVRELMRDVDVMVVPGLAFDRAGNRLGYGGGHYDRMMSAETKTSLFRLGIAFGFQILESVPFSDGDVRLDGIATEQELVRV